MAYPGFFGGVRLAAGDVTGDGTDDLVTSPGPGGGPNVKVFDGRSRSTTPIQSFMAYDPRFTGGVYIAVGNIDNSNGAAEIITGAGAGGGPHVKVFRAQSNLILASQFFAYEPTFTGGVRVATGDVNGDTHLDIITAPGPGGGPRVRAFNGPLVATNNFSPNVVLDDLFPYEPNFFGGLFVAGVRGQVGQAQRAATSYASNGQSADLTQQEVDAAVNEALDRLEKAGFSQADISYLRTVRISVADLSGDLLGYATNRGIVLDVNAAGNGWFIDPTLGQDEEFAPAPGTGLLTAVAPAAMNRMDLLTVVMHELGHKLGLDDIQSQLHPDALMNETLSAGTRRLPTSDEVDEAFADGSLLDSLLLN